MIEFLKRNFVLSQTKFSFGATSAIITSLGLITGLRSLSSPKLSIIGGLLIIAVADNIADSLGIHIYQEAENLRTREVWFSTVSNFLTRLFLTFTFICLVILFPMPVAVFVSTVWGMILLSLLSYSIAVREKKNPYLAIAEHILIAAVVIMISNFLGQFFTELFVP